MVSKEKKEFIKKVEAWAYEKFGGSGDPEVEDAVDVVDYFTEMFGQQLHVFHKLLQDVCTRIESLDTSWNRAAGIKRVLDTPEQGDTVKFQLAPWMLGFGATDAIKGKSKMPQIFKTIVDFLEKPYASAAEPLDVLMPTGLACGSELPPFSVRHNVGFAKSLTIRVILFATVDMRWDDTTMSLFKKELQALTCIECVYSPAEDPKGQMTKALGDKMMAAERTRPDVLQIAHALQRRALAEGEELLGHLDQYISEFQDASVSETRKFSDLEVKAVKIIPLLTPSAKDKLAYHYQAYDVESSAWPLSKLAADAMFNGTRVQRSGGANPLPAEAVELWTAVCSVSERQKEANIARRIGVFIYKIKEALRTKKTKNLNLKFFADSYRCKLSDDLAFEVAALFTHWGPAWQSMMSNENWAKCVLKFKRGGLDSQLVEKCTSKVFHKSTDFRFLQAYGSVSPEMPLTEETLDAQQEAAQAARENAELEEIRVLLAREENKWRKYKHDVAGWKCRNTAQRFAFKEEERVRNLAVMQQEMNLRFPGRDLKNPDHIHTFVSSSIDAYIMDTTSSRENCYIVWVINLSISGYLFMHSSLQAIVKAAESISQSPERVCAIIITPNTGTYGDSYNDVSMTVAAHDIEELLKDPDMGIMYRPVSMSFDEATIPNQSSRPGQHPAFMMISSMLTTNEKPKSHFAMSKMWIRKSVSQLPIQKLKESVNPLVEMTKGDFNAEKDLSKSQRRKQWFAGWKFMAGIRTKLWQGMPVTSANHAAWVDVYGYDFSIGQCIQCSAFSGTGERLKQPTEMVCTLFWADMDTSIPNHNELLLSFHHKACKRSLKELLREKLYFLDGWAEVEFTESTASPSYKPMDYKATFPAASGDLPLRHEWIMLMQAKFKTSEAAAAFSILVEEHDKNFNPSQQPYTGEQGLKRKPEETAQKPDAHEIPYEEGAPDTKEKFLAANKDTLVIEALGQEFLYTTSGELWCHGKVDDVVDTKLPVSLVFGMYALNDQAQKEIQGGKAWKFELSSTDELVQCSSAVKKDACPEGLAPLSTILTALENPKIECHDSVPKFIHDDAGTIVAQEYEIKCTKVCSYTPTKIPKEFNEEWENAATRMFLGSAIKNWNMATKEHNSGRFVVKFRLHHQESKQFEGINPVKPGIFLKSPVKVKAGTLRRWC